MAWIAENPTAIFRFAFEEFKKIIKPKISIDNQRML